MIFYGKKENIPGFTLIEAMVFVFIFSVITLAFYSTITLGSQYIIESKNRLAGVALAREKMEIARNLKFEDIGTIGGIPEGSLTAEEDVLAGSKTYHVVTSVYYVDDALDGETYPTDEIPSDYKTVKIAVSWGGPNNQTSSVQLVSRFVPLSVETELGEGILAINILDGYGTGVADASIDIVNSEVSPQVNISGEETDSNGYFIYSGPASASPSYEITVAKDGYETIETVLPDSVPYTPIDSHATLIEAVYNIKTIIINKLADLQVQSVDTADVAIPDVGYHLEGGRILGNDFSAPPVPTYNFSVDDDTGGSGEQNYENISPGEYFISEIEAVDGYTFIGTDPLALAPNSPLGLAPDGNETIKIKFASNSSPSLLVFVSDINYDPALPINDAEVRLSNETAGYDQTVTTLADGLAFFPLTSDPLAAGTYTLEVTAPNYQDYDTTVEIDSSLVEQEVDLTPQ